MQCNSTDFLIFMAINCDCIFLPGDFLSCFNCFLFSWTDILGDKNSFRRGLTPMALEIVGLAIYRLKENKNHNLSLSKKQNDCFY